MKAFFSLLLFLLSFSSFAQLNPVLYGGVDYFRNKGFNSNAYINFNIGAQVFKWQFFAPEVGFEHYFGRVNDINEMNPQDPQARPPSKLASRFSTNHFSLAPKMIFGNEEAALVIIPQYNFGKIAARGDLLRDNGNRYLLDDQQSVSESIAFWSFAAGVEGQIFDSEIFYFSLLLKYHFLNSETVLEQIAFDNHLSSTGGSANGLGMAFRVYFDLFRLLKKWSEKFYLDLQKFLLSFANSNADSSKYASKSFSKRLISTENRIFENKLYYNQKNIYEKINPVIVNRGSGNRLYQL